VGLQKGVHKKTVRDMQGPISFLRACQQARLPPNVFITMDTHATASGHIQFGGGVSQPLADTVKSILQHFLGREFFTETERSAALARSFENAPANEWYSTSPKERGGWRVLLLCTCGPAVRVNEHLAEMTTMVKE
jgi:hypothetical protein